MAFKTIIVGDETVPGLDKSLRTMPGTLPLWRLFDLGAEINNANAKKITDRISEIKADFAEKGGPDIPTAILVSMGRSEILNEPDDSTDKDMAELAADTKSFVSKLSEAGDKVLWVLPPAITGERKSRAAISKALEDNKVRVFHSEKVLADTKASRDKPQFADLPDEAYSDWAKKIAAWVPLGPRATVIVPRHEAAPPVTKAIESIKTVLSSWSRNEKIAAGVAAAVVVVGGAVVIGKLSKRKQ